jgi:hypothetical protein
MIRRFVVTQKSSRKTEVTNQTSKPQGEALSIVSMCPAPAIGYLTKLSTPNRLGT